jgi:serine/threonine-protein kinase
LLTFIQQKGKSWTTVLFLQLLNDLDKLHENGWVFGDLKPENLIVTGPPPRIRCIDVGGTTIQGRAIKEFTEFFDRGYWGLGSRKAEPSYDLFAVAMIMINLAYPKRFSKTTGGISQLREAIRLKPELKPLETVMAKSLQGSYDSAKQMRADLLDGLVDKKVLEPPLHSVGTPPRQTQSTPSKGSGQNTRQNYRRKKKKKGLRETMFIAVVMLLLYGVISYLSLK